MRRALRMFLAAAVATAAVVPLAGLTAIPAGAHEEAERTAPGAVEPGPTGRYVDELHHLFLGRAATAGEIDAGSVLVHSDARAALAASLATSDEWAGARVDDLYRTVLGRPADPTGRAGWVRAIAAGLRLEDVAAGFYGSEEYWDTVGRTHSGYVDALYAALLGRSADPAGHRHWTEHLERGSLDRAGVAARFHASVESRHDRVRARYREVLGREPDPGGLRHWADRLLVTGDIVLAAHLAASPEFHLGATSVLPPAIRVVPVGPGTAYPLSSSWRPGCPVHHRDLVAIEFPHWSDDGSTRTGVLVVHRRVVPDVAYAVRVAFGTGFPLTSARPVDDFGGDDDRSMAADNSSAFNCRPVAGTTTWSQHAYGTAVDLNPVRNPYVRGGDVQPPEGEAWLDRNDVRPGMIVEGGPLVAAFDRLGWGWGGRWRSAQDHQHFSENGR